VNCSNKCAQRAYKKANRKPEPWNERRKARYQRRRARKLQLPADLIRPRDVFERDAWVCGLCGDPVSEGVAWPDPLSASLDHVTPLSKGGHHVLENVQLAHLSCNVQKGARTP
jgi:5-methylcytosine-specific restriction endonuclease McrA